jgi:hypothetical protein
MTALAEPVVHDELDSVVANLCARFPKRSRFEIETVVASVYAQLVANARVTAHLIPLTLNISRRLLSEPMLDSAVGDSRSTGA